MTMKIKFIATVIAVIIPAMQSSYAQASLTIDQVIALVLKNNSSLKAISSETEAQRALGRTSFDLPKTEVMLMYGQYNGYATNDNNITVSQAIPFTAFGSLGSLNRATLASSEMKLEVTENELIYQVRQVFLQLTYAVARHALLQQQDSMYENFRKSATLRYSSGETNLLEQTTAEVQRNEIGNQLLRNEAEILGLRTQLKTFLNSRELPAIIAELREFTMEEITDSLRLTNNNPSLRYLREQINVASSQKKVEAAHLAPDILIGFFSQTLIGVENLETGALAAKNERFTGFQVGLSIPLWFAPQKARVKSASLRKKAAEYSHEQFAVNLKGQHEQALQQHRMAKRNLDYYQSSALPNASLILKQAQIAFREGDISYPEYLMGLRNAASIKEGYLTALRDYNLNILLLNYLSGNK